MTIIQTTVNAVFDFLKVQGETLAGIFGVSLGEAMIFIWIGILILFLFLLNKFSSSIMKWGVIAFLIFLLFMMLYIQ